MKIFIFSVLFTYAVLFAADYYAAYKHFDEAMCARWMKHPWQLHLLMPGPGNYCLDQGWVK